ncbi:MAG: hypothetical protein ACRCYZ_03495 [Alphaproteobacteria bacterium]
MLQHHNLGLYSMGVCRQPSKGAYATPQRFTAAILTSFFIIPAEAGSQKNPIKSLKNAPELKSCSLGKAGMQKR